MSRPASDAWREAYRGRRVLLLGATGFIGRWVARALAAAGADLCLGVRDRTRLAEVGSRFGFDGETYECDLAQPGGVESLLAAVRPAVTFNLAGYGVGPGERDPELSNRLNGELVAELCAAAGDCADGSWPGVDLVHVGSVLEYGPVAGALHEDSPANPTTPYGRSKLLGTETLVRAVSAGRVRAVSARLFTVYGPGEMEGRLLPSLVAAARSGDTVALTSGRQRRDFLFVEDVAEAILRLGVAPSGREAVVHVASGTPMPVREFVATAAEVLGLEPERLRFGALESPWYEIEPTTIETGRLRRRTSWSPSVTVAEGVARTASFLGLPVSSVRAEPNAGEAPIEAMSSPSLSLVLACGAEGERLRSFARDLARAFSDARIDLELILVEWDATEATRRAVEALVHERLPVRRIESTEVRGYGHAVRLGLAAGRGRFVGHTSADGHVDAAATLRIFQLAAEVETPRLAKVRRRFRLDGPARKVVSTLYNLTAGALFGGLGSLDLNGSPKIFPRPLLDRLALVSDGWFLDSEIVLKARRIGLPVLETNVVTQLSHDVLAPIRVRTGWELFAELVAFRLGLGRVARSLRR